MSLVYVVKIIFTIKKNLNSVKLSIINKSVFYQVNFALSKQIDENKIVKYHKISNNSISFNNNNILFFHNQTLYCRKSRISIYA